MAYAPSQKFSRTIIRGGYLSIGPPAANFDQISSVAQMGISTGGITITFGVTTVPVASDAFYGLYGQREAEPTLTVEANLHEISLFNLQVISSFPKSAITSDGGTSNVLSLDAQKLAANPFRALVVTTESPEDDSATPTVRERKYEFYKVKAYAGGGVVLNRTDLQALPVRFDCFVNDNDVWGRIIDVGATWSDPGYE